MPIIIEEADSPISADDYVVIDSTYRLVRPYYFDFICNVKQRWDGQNIIDIFTKEFPAKDREYYLKALSEGKLRAEGLSITAETTLRSGMRMRHLLHRHEPPVPALPIPIIAETPDIVAICKPHGMPVHVSGQYRKNTVLGVLSAERRDLGQLWPVHRLDKPVSGVLLFARSAESANALREGIEGHNVEKVYVARVLGKMEVTGQPIRVEADLSWDPATNIAFVVPSSSQKKGDVGDNGQNATENGALIVVDGDKTQEVVVQHQDALIQNETVVLNDQGNGEEILETRDVDDGDVQSKRQRKKQKKRKNVISKADRIAAVEAQRSVVKDPYTNGRPAVTLVTCLYVSPDEKTSVVECRPLTGRTHQIRVHLAHLGHPIANDGQYGGVYSGPGSARQLSKKLGVLWSDANLPDNSNSEATQQSNGMDTTNLESTKLLKAVIDDEQGRVGLPSEFPALHRMQLNDEECDTLCTHCPGFVVKDYPVDLRPLWLHAKRYTFDGRTFESEMPSWAERLYTPSTTNLVD